MRHLKRFNESEEFKNSDDAIREFFIDYIDNDPESVEITNGWINDGEFVWEADYIRKSEASQYKKAKLVKIKVSEATGIELGDYRCITSLEPLKKAISDIERFYALSEEEVNFSISTGADYSDALEVTFVTKGEDVKEEEASGDDIDELLSELSRILKTSKGFNYKRVSDKGNWLEIRTPVKDRNRDIHLSNLLRRVGTGAEDGTTDGREWVLPLVNWRNKAYEKGFQMVLTGGDNQVVVKLKKV